MVARRAEKTLKGALLSADGALPQRDHLLPAVAIYGANASGKSNFLFAFAYMRHAILSSQSVWKSGTGTRFDPNVATPEENGEFEVVIFEEGIKYRYGFLVRNKYFVEEWLYSYPKGRERLLFRRESSIEQNDDEDNDSKPSVFTSSLETGGSFAGDKREHDSSFRRTRENSLFLSSAAQDNQADCVAVESWFRRKVISEIRLNINELDQGQTSYMANQYGNFKSLLIPLLRAADPCIKDIVVQKPDGEDSIVSDESSKPRKADYKVNFVVECENGNILIPFSKQSRGVKRLYALASGLITGLKFGKVVIIDELETSMHAQVASQLLALFQNVTSNPRGAQLIFTTHETRLLNLQHLRRDQVWFCERDTSGESTLFSLLEFAPRKDENFEMGYLRGRYGAVPLAGIDPSWLTAINDDQLTISSDSNDG
jgi:predicted ATPase